MSCFDSGDSSNDRNIRDKINDLRSNLNVLRKKLDLEKTLLNKRKSELFGGNAKEYSEYPRQMHHTTPTTIAINKGDLRDIERKCDIELVKLKDYISQVNQLKSTWKEARQISIPDSVKIEEKPWNDPVRKQQSKGKVFFIDNNRF